MPDDAPNQKTVQPVLQSLARPRGKWRRSAARFVGLIICAGIGGAVWVWPELSQPERARRPRPDTLAVVVATASRQDVPIWLDALGIVQATNTVTIRPMVDGPLLEVRFREGQDVAAGEVLARIDSRSIRAALDQAEAKKAQDEAQLANARLDLERYTRLAQSSFAPTQQVDTARAQVAQLEAQTRQDQAQIDNARTQLSYTTITAPAAGRAGIRLVDQGNIVHANEPAGLVVITTIQPIVVLFTLPQQKLPAVMAAARAGTPEVLALSQSADAAGPARLLDRGTLDVIDNQVDPATGTIRLKARFPNAEQILWPGGFVSVRLRVDTLRGAVTVPPAAVQRGPRGSFIYGLGPGETVSRRAVSIGYEGQDLSVVTDGVQPGESVVTDGTARLLDGMRVTIAAPAPAPSGPEAAVPPGARRRGEAPAAR